jgi:hypothetical protein
MRKVVTLLVFSFFTLSTVFAQSDSIFQLIRSFQGDIRMFTADHLGNLYLVDRKDQVKKISSKGDSLAIYNDVRRLGPLHSIDVSNPCCITAMAYASWCWIAF